MLPYLRLAAALSQSHRNDRTRRTLSSGSGRPYPTVEAWEAVGFNSVWCAQRKDEGKRNGRGGSGGSTGVTLLFYNDLIADLIRIVVRPREVFRQNFATFTHGSAESLSEITRFDPTKHVGHYPLPRIA